MSCSLKAACVKVEPGEMRHDGDVNSLVFCLFYLQAAVWHALNHYAYRDAVFLAERLYAEGKALNLSLHALKPSSESVCLS